MNVELELSQELHGHEKAVRCVAVFKNGTVLVTGGMDNLVILWIKDETTQQWKLKQALQHHTDFVFCLAEGNDCFYSGGKDKLAFKLDFEGSPLLQFAGHEGTVNSVASSPDFSKIVTGSWDGKFRLFDANSAACLKTVEAGVHAIATCVLDNDALCTSSQDAILKKWSLSSDSCKEFEKSHSDIVRKLCYCNNHIFSCSNDQSIKMWSTDGVCMSDYLGHDGFVFDIAVTMNSPGDFPKKLYSGGEDRMLKIWNLEDNRMPLQSILHSNTVWGIGVLDKGDVATACADGILRIWTNDPARMADEAARKAQAEGAIGAAAEASQKGASSVALPSNLPDESDMLRHPGKKMGEVKMFKSGAKVNAYTWNGSAWDLVGEVTGRPKVSYEGDQYFQRGEYDFVFDVELGEGGITAKLPCNQDDNQMVVAEKFIAREGIHKTMLEQILKFLRANVGNTPGPTFSMGGGNSSSTGAPTPPPQAQPAAKPETNTKHFPVMSCLFFEAAKFDALKGKILEFNSTFSDEEPDFKMDSVEIMHFEEAVKKVESKDKKDFRPVERDLVWKKCASWPPEKLFPVLDLWRLYLLHPDSSALFKGADRGISYLLFALRTLKGNTNSPLGISCARVLANMFKTMTVRWVAFDKRDIIAEELKPLLSETWHKQAKVAISTLFLNMAVSFSDKNEQTGRDAYFSLILQWASAQGKDDPESLYRCLAAVGTIVNVAKGNASLKEQLLGVLGQLNTSEDRLAQVVAELKQAV